MEAKMNNLTVWLEETRPEVLKAFFEKVLSKSGFGVLNKTEHYFEPQGPRINREWQLWQHSERGKVNGIRANVDFNVFNGDADDFEDLLLP